MVDLCKCYGKVQVLVLQVLSPSDPLSECIFDLMPFDVSALSSLPLGDLCGVSPARPLPRLTLASVRDGCHPLPGVCFLPSGPTDSEGGEDDPQPEDRAGLGR